MIFAEMLKILRHSNLQVKAGKLWLEQGRNRSLVLPIYARYPPQQTYSRTLLTSSLQLKNLHFSEITPDSDVILITIAKDGEKQTIMKYSQVLEQVLKQDFLNFQELSLNQSTKVLKLHMIHFLNP